MPNTVTLQTTEVLDTIVKVITPYLGKSMAQSAATAHCGKLGITGDQMDLEQMESLTNRIKLALNIFIGREKSQAVVDEINYILIKSRRTQ